MVKYLFKRLLQGLVSVVIVVACVMVMIYSLMDRTLIFAKDTNYSHQSNNQKVAYRYEKWETYGYLDYVTYADYLNDLATKGEIDEETRSSAVSIGRKAKKDSDLVKEYVQKFTDYYESKGYTVVRLDAVMMNQEEICLRRPAAAFRIQGCSADDPSGKIFFKPDHSGEHS